MGLFSHVALRNGLFSRTLSGLASARLPRCTTAGALFSRWAALLLIVAASEGIVATPADAGSGESMCNNYNPVLFTNGSTTKVVSKMVFVGSPPYISTIESKIMGPTTFRGHKVIDIRHYIGAAHPGMKTREIVDEFDKIGRRFIYTYGFRNHAGWESYNDPPMSFPKHYVVNTPYTSVSVIRNSVNDTESSGGTRHVTSTFLGMQSITVPAGTFMTCKIKDQLFSGVGKPKITYRWIVASGRYAGLPVKDHFYSATGSSFGKVVTLSLQVNGK